MKIYKDKQYLVFDFEDGKNVKYDFATKTAIGIKGKPVKDLNKQLQGLTLNDLFDNCTDQNYANFLKFVQKEGTYGATNIGTILRNVPKLSQYEQIFSAGFEDVIDLYPFKYHKFNISDIPKSLIKVAKDHKIRLKYNLIEYWKENIDAHYLAYQLEYMSLDDNDILNIITKSTYNYKNYKEYSYFNILINEYNYNAKSLLLYFDTLKTFEAIDDMRDLIVEFYDYVKLMSFISKKYDKYPRHFLTTHQIACRNYNRLKREFSEDLFKQRINKKYECGYKDYIFIYPNCTQDIKDEAVQQNNCVASYIDKVIDGNCHILFLRKKDHPKESLITIEVRDNEIVQAKRKFNYPVTKEDQQAIDYWNKKFSKIDEKNEENEKFKKVS